MLRYKMDLMLKACIMPISEYEFYKKDYMEELKSKTDIEEYKEYFNKTFMKAAYGMINKTNRIYNLDEINLLFDKFYPKIELNKSKSISMYYMRLLSKMSKCFICHRNGRIALKYWECEGEEDLIGPYKGLNKIVLWNSLNRMFTTDLLVVVYLLDNKMDKEEYLNGYYSTIMIEDLQLEQVLKRGVAETHIHRGAGISFYLSWEDMMNLTCKSEKSYKDELFEDVVIAKGFELRKYVMAVACLRILMAYFLLSGEHDYKCFIEDKYNNGNIKTDVKKRIKQIKQDEDIYNLINNIFDGTEISEKYNFRKIWDRIKETIGFTANRNEQKRALEGDILKQLFKCSDNINTSVENVFLFKCIKYIRINNDDYFFSKLFWQYIRIKNEVFQLKVQGNLIKGLINFQNYYDRSTDMQGYTANEYWKLIMLNQFQNTHLRKLELRVGFGNEQGEKEIKYKIKKIMRSFFEAYKDILKSNYLQNKENSNIPNVGLVFHMIKQRDRKENEKCWQNFKDGEDCELYYRELQSKYRNQIRALNELREEIPGLSDYIIGIDAASIENNTEPWVFAPIYEKARDSSTHKTIYINSERANRIKNLGFTFHAGEDFRHILTGLRRIDEVIDSFKFHAGDRIGHGIALGIDICKWIQNNKIVILPRGEYLDNLIWLWGLYKDGSHMKCFDNAYLEQLIMKHAQKIYGNLEGITIYNLWKAYKNKFQVFNVKQDIEPEIRYDTELKNQVFCKYVKAENAMSWNEEKLTYAQHCKCYIEHMDEPIQVEINEQDAEMIRQVQKIILRKISTSGIVVETNPTSNITLGEVNNIFEHYIHSLNQRGLSSEINPENAVMVTINSDDPSVFNTNVSNEFAYIFYSLQEKGYSREDILLWIDKVRKYGMDSSFIDDRQQNVQEKISEIEEILKRIKN